MYEPILLQHRHPELFDAYREHFINGFDWRYYNTRTGHVRPSCRDGREDYLGTWRRMKVRGRNIPLPYDPRSRNRLIEKHLGAENWNRHVAATGRGKPLGEPFFLGLYAGKTTRHIVFDIDSHGGRRLHYRRRGRRMPVADLRLDTLRDVKKLYNLDRRPDVLMTSSPSLGLYAYFQFKHSIDTAEALGLYREKASSVGLDCETYPNMTNCLRRPMGDGSFILSPYGILRDFPDQMRYYLDPDQLPPFSEVVEMLLELWAEQHDEMVAYENDESWREWRDPVIDVAREYDYMASRAREIRSWLASGSDECGPRKETNVVEFVRQAVIPKLFRMSREGSQSWPAAWKEPHRHWRDRVWHLARFGLPLPDTLNCALLDLAQWLLGVEFYDDEVRDEKVQRLLEIFCATRHNRQSDRLGGVETVEDIPKSVIQEIVTATRNAYGWIEKETFVRMRQRHYLNPLKVASLLAGEGPENRYQPGLPFNSSQQEENTLALPLSVAVSSAIIPDIHEEMNFEAMIQSGILDLPLPRSIEERITNRGKALLFLRRLGNYLYIRGSLARIHHSKLALFAEVDVEDRKALSRYKAVGIKVNLFHESDGYVVGQHSIQYSLTDEACHQIRLDRGARGDCVEANIRQEISNPFAPINPFLQGENREML